MKKNEGILLYDYLRQIPVGVFESLNELAVYLGRNKAVTSCGICRVNKGINDFITDTNGHKYQPYIVKFTEE